MITLTVQAWLVIAAAGMGVVLMEIADMIRTRTGRAQEIAGAVALSIGACAIGSLAGALGQGYSASGSAWGAVAALGAATLLQMAAVARAAGIALRAPLALGASTSLFLVFAALSHPRAAAVWTTLCVISIALCWQVARRALSTPALSIEDAIRRAAAQRAAGIIGALAVLGTGVAGLNIAGVIGPGLGASLVIAITTIIAAGCGLLITLGAAGRA